MENLDATPQKTRHHVTSVKMAVKKQGLFIKHIETLTSSLVSLNIVFKLRIK